MIPQLRLKALLSFAEKDPELFAASLGYDRRHELASLMAGAWPQFSHHFNLRVFVQSVLTPYSKLAAGKGLGFYVGYQSSFPYLIRGDPIGIGCLLRELLNNALKYTQRGSLLVQLRYTGTLLNQQLKLVVIDTGPGLSPLHQQRLYSEESPASYEDRLGLYLVRYHTRRLHGKVLVRSQSGQGTIIECILPVAWTESGEQIVKKRFIILSYRIATPRPLYQGAPQRFGSLFQGVLTPLASLLATQTRSTGVTSTFLLGAGLQPAWLTAKKTVSRSIETRRPPILSAARTPRIILASLFEPYKPFCYAIDQDPSQRPVSTRLSQSWRHLSASRPFHAPCHSTFLLKGSITPRNVTDFFTTHPNQDSITGMRDNIATPLIQDEVPFAPHPPMEGHLAIPILEFDAKTLQEREWYWVEEGFLYVTKHQSEAIEQNPRQYDWVAMLSWDGLLRNIGHCDPVVRQKVCLSLAPGPGRASSIDGDQANTAFGPLLETLQKDTDLGVRELTASSLLFIAKKLTEDYVDSLDHHTFITTLEQIIKRDSESSLISESLCRLISELLVRFNNNNQKTAFSDSLQNLPVGTAESVRSLGWTVEYGGTLSQFAVDDKGRVRQTHQERSCGALTP